MPHTRGLLLCVHFPSLLHVPAIIVLNQTHTGMLLEDYLREILTTLGDRFTHNEVKLLNQAPIRNGQFDYVEFTRILKHGTVWNLDVQCP